MAENLQTDLPYGHYGRAEYDNENNRWEFVRALVPSQSFYPLGEARSIIPPAIPSEGNDDSKARTPPGQRYKQQVHSIVQSHPELQPALTIIPRLLRTSDTLRNSILHHNPNHGNLLALAEIRSVARRRRVRIAALVAGASCSLLRLVRLRMRKRGWSQCRGIWLDVPDLRGDTLFSQTTTSPIRQLRFSEPIRGGDLLLAVRYELEIRIFRPVVGSLTDQESQVSGGHLEYLHKISIDHTGNHPHADIAFNPFLCHQIGIVDQTGTWSVQRFRSRNFDRVEKRWRGIPPPENSATTSRTSDGWARISWILNEKTLVLCTRHGVTLIDISEDDPLIILSPKLPTTGGIFCVLDFIVVPGHFDHFCLLTSTHLMVYQVTDAGLAGVTLCPRLKLRHYKNPEHIELRLTVWCDQDDVILTLYSSLDTSISTFRVRFSEAGRLYAGDPSMVDMVLPQDPSWSSPGVTSLHIENVALARKPGVSTAQRKGMPFDPGDLRFAVLLALHHDMSLSEQAFYRIHGGARHSRLPDLDREAKKIQTRTYAVKEDFIVSDKEDLSREENLQARTEPVPRHVRRPPMRASPSERPLDLAKTMRQINSNTGSQAMEQVLDTLRSRLSLMDQDSPLPTQLLADIAGFEPTFDDVETVHDRFQDLKREHVLRSNLEDSSQLQNTSRIKIQQVAFPAVLSTPAISLATSLAASYDRIVANWVASLSAEIPGRTRQLKEQLARRVAAEILLASHVLRLEDPPAVQTQNDDPISGPRMSGTWELPVRVSQTSIGMVDRDAITRNTMRSTQISALPTPSPTATPSVTTTSSYPSTFATAEISRLSRLTTFAKPPPPALPRSLVNVLSHWTVGEDPAQYDWLSTSKRIAQIEEGEEEHMPERDRARLQRKAQRHLERQRKHAEARRIQDQVSSQMPVVVSGSQPSATRRGGESQPVPTRVASSSQPDGFVASQVEPGRFGGRRPPKKKRRYGF